MNRLSFMLCTLLFSAPQAFASKTFECHDLKNLPDIGYSPSSSADYRFSLVIQLPHGGDLCLTTGMSGESSLWRSIRIPLNTYASVSHELMELESQVCEEIAQNSYSMSIHMSGEKVPLKKAIDQIMTGILRNKGKNARKYAEHAWQAGFLVHPRSMKSKLKREFFCMPETLMSHNAHYSTENDLSETEKEFSKRYFELRKKGNPVF